MSTKSILFASLLAGLFSISVIVKGSDTLGPNPTLDFDSDFDDELLTLPLKSDRYYIIEETLDELGASVNEPLITIMLELTLGYDKIAIKNLLIDMVKESKTDFIDQEICLKKLTESIRKYDKKHLAVSKLNQLAAIILKNFSLAQDNDKPKIIDEQEIYPKSNNTKYPLLDDVFHPNKILFRDATKQLKSGKFRKSFRKGMLLYDPPGGGKNAMVEAMVNESDCHLFNIAASKLVNKYQGSGAEAIREIFAEAKAVEANKGVIILIDELQSLSPTTTDKDAKLLYKHEGQDYNNSLAQIWTEYDDCSKNHDNILVVATCNKFEIIDKRIRDRFRCIEFSCPDRTGAYEILKRLDTIMFLYLKQIYKTMSKECRV